MGSIVKKAKRHIQSGAGYTGASSDFFRGSTEVTGLPAAKSKPQGTERRRRTRQVLGNVRTPLNPRPQGL